MRKRDEGTCNPKVVARAAMKTGEDPVMMKEIVSHCFEFVVETMKRGGMESVEIPYLGKFKVKVKKMQKMEYIKARARSIKHRPE